MTSDFSVNMNEYLPLRDVVFNTLRQAILKGELKPGERLMEIALAEKLLAGEEITTPLDLGVEGYTALEFREGSETVLEGEGWMVITAENVDSLGF